MPFALSRIIVIAAALALDLMIGDPQNPLHPMRLIGNAISLGIKRYRAARPRTDGGQFAMGAVLSLTVILTTFFTTLLITWAAYQLNLVFGLVVEAVICYFCLACKCLKVESMKVHDSLKAGDIEAARFNLSMIVSRDTADLDEAGLVKGAVETVAENFSDGVIAPLFCLALGGAPLGMAYKAVNTLDSMIGYKTEEFLYFGRFAAKLDDAVNYLPARLSALLLVLASGPAGLDGGEASRIHARDKRNHASPNSAQTISACAGALGLELGGATSYHGQLVQKPTIGDAQNDLAPEQIVAANRLMYAATFIAAALALGLWAAALACSALVARGMANLVTKGGGYGHL
jgi:adenosylcobinamide-phosphate synthase